MPSDAETFGRVVIEGMASGTVVVATNAGGVPDIIDHNKTGLLFEPRDTQSLANLLESLILSPDLRHQLAAAALQKCQQNYSTTEVRKRCQVIFSN